ncbi:hypothetical protein FRC03_010093 [Tulasnella sp. 419]|nr:hypothetical protein FRC02_000008 [Tulasnella sp. 418]KAG8967348.1 hypothetical protein FRC03_010093 [Tulasnella sp. 419]
MKLTLSFTLLLASSVIAQSSSETQTSSVEAASTPAATSSPAESSLPASNTRTGTRSSTNTGAAASSSTPSGQSNTQGTVNTVIPDGISQRCKTFLNKLNSDSEVASYIASLVSVTAGGSSNLVSTLDTLSKSGASDTLIRGYLTSFGDECKEELNGSSPNTDVKKLYDAFYIINPLRGAITSKDPSTQQYCLVKTTSNKARSVHGLSARQMVQQPDFASWKSSGMPFLRLNPSTDAAELCTPCTQKVLGVWATWQRRVIHACGISNSLVLGDEPELYAKVAEVCGDGFLSVVNSASSTGSSTSSGVALDIPGLQGLMSVMALGAWVVL